MFRCMLNPPKSQLSQLSGRPKLRRPPELPANTVPLFAVPNVNHKVRCTVMRRAQALLAAPNAMPSGEF